MSDSKNLKREAKRFDKAVRKARKVMPQTELQPYIDMAAQIRNGRQR